jgi:hypothetical protein
MMKPTDGSDALDDGSERDRYLWRTEALTHPPYAVLCDWVESCLPEKDLVRLEAHLRNCPTCAAEARDLRGFTDTFRQQEGLAPQKTRLRNAFTVIYSAFGTSVPRIEP